MTVPINKTIPIPNTIGCLISSLNPHKKTQKANTNIDFPINLHSAFSSYSAFSSLLDVLYPDSELTPTLEVGASWVIPSNEDNFTKLTRQNQPLLCLVLHYNPYL